MIAKILIVDDDPEIRRTMREILEAAHHEVLEATDGAQAFAMAEEHRPHLIFMDVVMPGLYGTTAVKKIQEYREMNDIPVVVFSGAADRKLVEQSGLDTNSKTVSFLKKPSDSKTILETVRKMLPEGGYTK